MNAETPTGKHYGRIAKDFIVFIPDKIRSLWKRVRRPHLLWEISFALVLAVYFAYYYAGFERPVYTIYVLIGSNIPNMSVREARESLLRPAQFLTVHGTAVRVQIVDVPSDDPSKAIEKAQTIRQNGDALLVVGILDSTPTEESLPVYLHERPQIPFIATVQTNNDLVKKCDNTCFDTGQLVPLLQLSPTNTDEAKWAVKFATEQGLRRFLVVTDDQSANHSYVTGLKEAFEKEIPASFVHDGGPVSSVSEKLLKKPDCILYAGDPGNAQELLETVEKSVKVQPQSEHRWMPRVILSDTAVPSTIDNIAYNRPVELTDQSDASYYIEESQPNAYALDGITIAITLLRELDERGFDWWVSLKSKLLNRTDAGDIRRNLLRIIQEDMKFHSSFRGSESTGFMKGLSTVYTFDCPSVGSDGNILRKSEGSANYCQRYGGIFHVWSWDPKKKAMTDIDPWHPRRLPSRR